LELEATPRARRRCRTGARDATIGSKDQATPSTAVEENGTARPDVDAQSAGVLATTADIQNDFELGERTNRVEAELIANKGQRAGVKPPLPR
jgi:hypothetical protein